MSNSTAVPPETPMGPPRSTQTPHKSAASFRTPMRTPGEQTSHTPVIDFEAIEAQKENVQPLLKGRSAYALNTALGQKQAVLKAQRKEHENLVNSQENAESDDPLEAWIRYIEWCRESYPSGHTKESELVLVLERCTRLFKDSTQYQSDSRYLKIWISYAQHVDCPTDIYNFLLANEIGTHLASLYEELAKVYEQLSSFEKADETYQMGIHRSAQPQERLERRFNEYRLRILSREGHSGQEMGAYKVALKQAMAKAQRAMLGNKIGSTSASANTVRGLGGQGGLEGIRAKVVSNGAKPSLFKDGEGEDVFARPLVKGGWSDAGTSATRKKEMMSESKKWKGEVLPQRETITPKKPAIAVYRDSDEEEEEAHVKTKTGDVFTTMSASKETSEIDKLRRNPLLYFDKDTKEKKLVPAPTKRPASSKHASGSTNSKVKEASVASSTSSSKKEKYAIAMHLLYPGIKLEDAGQRRSKKERSGEVSMEELQAAKSGYQDDNDDPWSHLDDLEGRWLPEIKRRKEKTVRRDPTVTAYTKDAQDQVMEMFNKGMIDSDEESSDEQSESESEDDDEPLAPLAMLKENNAVPFTPTPAPRSTIRPIAAPVNAPESSSASSSSSSSSAPIMATPIRKAFGERKEGVEKKKFGEKQQQSSNALPQRMSEMAEEGESGEDSEEEYDYLNPPMREMIPLSPITEATECTRYTLAMRTPGTSTRQLQDSTSHTTPSHSQSDHRNQGILHSIDDAFVVSQESQLQQQSVMDNSMTDTASESGGCGSTWAGSQLGDKDKSSQRMPAGFTIEGNEGNLEENFDASLVFDEDDNFVIPNPCCPIDSQVIDSILSNLSLSIESSSDYVDCRNEESNKLDELQQRAQAVAHRRTSSSNNTGHTSTLSAKDWKLNVSLYTFNVLQKLGEGGFGAVFLAEDAPSLTRSRRVVGGINGDASFADVDEVEDGEDDEDEEDEEEAEKNLIAIKVETPPNRWEFYILGQLRARLSHSHLTSIICARKFFCFQDESFLLLEYGEKGTLLEIVNNSVKAGVASSTAIVGQASGPVGIDEILAMFFIIEIIKIVESLHSVNLIHGDLKIDNCLLRLEESKDTWTNSYDRTGKNGWSAKGVTLIDFGRAIDLVSFPLDQRFLADWKSDVHDCLEIRTNQSWKHEIDYHGIASIAYCLLFGKYIEVIENGSDQMQAIDKPLRRYWQVDLWTALFRICLNSGALSKTGMDVAKELSDVRSKMESWLEENCFRAGKNLKGSLKKLEIWSIKRSN